MRPTILTLTATLALATATPALADRYASPTGTTGAPCTLAAPCTIAKAISGTTLDDKVVRLFGGSYPDLGAQLSTHIDGTVIAAQPGTGRPVIHLNTSSQLEIGYGSSISDVDIVTASTSGEPLLLTNAGATGERLRVMGSVPGAMVKIGAIGSTPGALRDSLVVNDSTNTSASAVAIECNGCHSHAQR